MYPVSIGCTRHLVPNWIVTHPLLWPIARGLSRGISRGLIRANDATKFGNLGETERNAILTFHGVGEDPATGFYENIATDRFRDTIERLASIVEFVPLADVTEPADTRRVAVTFDDGLRSVYENALPVLREFDVPATVFLNPGYVGDRDPGAFATSHGIDDGRGLALSDEQVCELADSRLVTIGNHTMTHRDLTSVESEDERRTEIVASQRVLQDRYGIRAGHFSYPYGAIDDATRVLVTDTHDLSVTTTPRLIGPRMAPHDLPRLNGNHQFSRLQWEMTPASDVLHRLRSPWRDTTSGPGEVG